MQQAGQRRPVGKPRGMRRDRDCRSCKLRGVKCDLNRPSCGECISAGVPCGGYPQRVVWVGDGSSASSKESNTVASSSTRPRQSKSRRGASEQPASRPSEARERGGSTEQPASSPGDGSVISWSETDQNTSSFTESLVTLCRQIISLDGDALRSNRYLSAEAIHLISRLRDFVQARVDGHQASTTTTTTTTNEVGVWESEDAARYRLDALMGLKEALVVANPFAFIGIAAFAFFEVCDSGFGEWQRHLYGAKSLLDYHCKSREELDRLSQSVTGLMEMVARLVWFDTCGAIIRGTTDLIFEDWHRQILNDSFFRIIGCAADTFDLFTRISSGELTSNPLNCTVLAMDQLLKLSQGTAEWDRCSDASRCASVVAVLSRINDQVSPLAKPETISLAVDRACRVIATMPPSSHFYIHLAVPAYLSGINASTVQQCNVVRDYWTNSNHARSQGALAACEEKWKTKGLI